MIIDNGLLIFNCPHCDQIVTVLISELACCIFRHGYYCDENNIPTTQMNPHESKEICDSLVASGKIIGCGKPFRINNYEVEACDYI
jgi:hypothetical protein